MSNENELMENDAYLMPPPPPTPGKQMFPALNSHQRIGTGSGLKRPILTPGHSPLDWAALTISSTDLRNGKTRLARFTTAEIATHNKRDDLWMIIRGRVYDLTAYVPFHPGGVPQLLRAAGKDGTKLIMEIHPWVNIDMMISKCCIGYAISDNIFTLHERLQ
jgi:hypothetical protein